MTLLEPKNIGLDLELTQIEPGLFRLQVISPNKMNQTDYDLIYLTTEEFAAAVKYFAEAQMNNLLSKE